MQVYENSRLLTLKIGSKMSWQNVRGSFLPSGLVADLLNLPLAGSKYLADETQLNHSRTRGWGGYHHAEAHSAPSPLPPRDPHQASRVLQTPLLLAQGAHRSPHSFFIMSSTFLARSAGPSWPSPLAANLATYISANCFRVKAQPCSPDPKPTVPSTGSICKGKRRQSCEWKQVDRKHKDPPAVGLRHQISSVAIRSK